MLASTHVSSGAFARASVASVSCAADLLPLALPERREGLQRLAEQLAPARGPWTQDEWDASPALFSAALVRLQEVLYEAQDLAFDAGRTELVSALENTATAAVELQAAADFSWYGRLAEFTRTSQRELAAMSVSEDAVTPSSSLSRTVSQVEPGIERGPSHRSYDTT